MDERIATVIGATGLIGSNLVKILLRDPFYSGVRIITRRHLEYNHARTMVIVIDFADHEALKNAVKDSFAVFCAVGTTRKKVHGDMSAYREVDFDIPFNAANACSETGCKTFLLVSSVGASAKSSNFYLKMKGETEDAIKSIGNLYSVSVFRPSMLLGKRNEFRLFESILQPVVKSLSFLFPAKYKPVEGYKVAGSMISVSKKNIPGFNVYHYPEMMNSLK